MLGIDRIILNNFELKNFEMLKKKEKTSDYEISESFENVNELFSLKYSVNYNAITNKLFTIAELKLNPSKIIRGSNIQSASTRELIKSLVIVKEKLRDAGVDFSYKEAKVKEIELAVNKEMSFEDLEEVLLAIGRANFKYSNGFYSHSGDDDVPGNIRKYRSLYINKTNYTDVNRGKVVKIYDKKFNLKTKYKIDIHHELLRTEMLYKRDTYRELMGATGLTNSLRDLVMNFSEVEKIFKKDIKKIVFEKTERYIENVLKVNLKRDYCDFKEREKRKRESKKQLIEQGKNHEHIKKEFRGVFNHLKTKSWIFDKSFLEEIVVEFIPAKHQKRNFEKINKDFRDVTNLEKMKEFKKGLV